MNENLKALDAAIEADEELRAAFLAAVEDLEGDDRLQAIVDFANANGYEVSIEEVGDSGPDRELADEELALLSGGAGPFCTYACVG